MGIGMRTVERIIVSRRNGGDDHVGERIRNFEPVRQFYVAVHLTQSY